jgi:hypothetical protein
MHESLYGSTFAPNLHAHFRNRLAALPAECSILAASCVTSMLG